MLFPYQYVPHQMEKMQTFIDFIFHEVWCKAPITKSYSLDLFNPLPELWEVMRDFSFADPQPVGAKFFCEHVERIYKHFSPLSFAQIDQLKHWYQANNDLEKVCANDPSIQIARYVEIQAIHPELGKQIALFFRGLYENSLLSLATLVLKIGKLSDHSRDFFAVNKVGKCPFCGITDLKGIHHTRREAYDHYLPKYRYPFNSINFRNLAPACHECNSAYKLSKDPAYTLKNRTKAVQRRKVFYPYTSTPYTIELQARLRHSDIDKLTPADVTLQFGPPALNDEIGTWKEVYGIEERYKAKFCSNDAIDWLEQARILDRCHNVSPTAHLASLKEHGKQSSIANCNFLKIPFLDACEQIGIFESFQTTT